MFRGSFALALVLVIAATRGVRLSAQSTTMSGTLLFEGGAAFTKSHFDPITRSSRCAIVAVSLPPTPVMSATPMPRLTSFSAMVAASDAAVRKNGVARECSRDLSCSNPLDAIWRQSKGASVLGA